CRVKTVPPSISSTCCTPARCWPPLAGPTVASPTTSAKAPRSNMPSSIKPSLGWPRMARSSRCGWPCLPRWSKASPGPRPRCGRSAAPRGWASPSSPNRLCPPPPPPPQHRLHQKAAQAVLKALLPEAGTNLKGHLRSQHELLEASGYANRPKDFSELLHILDGELRLITP